MICEFCHNEINLGERAFLVKTAEEEAACCSECLGILAEECWTLQFKDAALKKAALIIGGRSHPGALTREDRQFLKSMNIRW